MHKHLMAEREDPGRDPMHSSVNSSLTVEPVPTTPHIKNEIKATWKKLKISLLFLLAVSLVAVGLLIYGCVQLQKASNKNIAMSSSLNNDIASFQNGGYLSLQSSNFSVSVDWRHYLLNMQSDPYQYIIADNTETAYNSSVFLVHNVTFECDPIESATQNFSGSVLFTVNYCTFPDGSTWCDSSNMSAVNTVSRGSFAVSVPYYNVLKTMSLKEGESECNAAGGYYDKAKLQCLTLYVITSICIKVSNNSDGWHLDTTNGGSGCTYPFDSPSIMQQAAYTSNVSRLIANMTYDFVIRVADDPYISLQALTQGKMSLEAVYKDTHTIGVHFAALGSFILGFAFVLGTILFFIKRRVKREFKSASRIPSHYSRPPMFRYLMISMVSFGVCIGVGFPLLSHWSEILAWTYTPFIGMMLVIWTGPIGMVSLLIFWQMLMKTPAWNVRMRSMLGSGVGAGVMVLCAFAVAILMKPWRFVYSTDPNAPDQLQVFFGILVILTFLPFGTLLLVICAQVFFKETIPDSDTTKSLISSGVITHRASPSLILGVVGIWVLVVIFLATAFLPPIWNVQTIGVYNVFDSPYSVIPGNKSDYAVIKLYLDVVVFYAFVLAVIVVALLASMSGSIRRLVGSWFRFKVGSFVIDTSLGEIGLITLVLALSIWWFWWWYAGYGRIADIPDKLERLARVFGHMTNLFASILLFPVTRNSMWVEIVGIPFERAIQYHRWSGVVVFIMLTIHMLVWWIKWSVDGTLLHNIFSVQNIPHADNWSIPMVELTWLGAAVMILLSQNYFRRRKFELFYYTHHFFIIFYITGLIHSWSMWYFTGGGMILWFIDRLIRYYKSALSFPVMDIQSHSGDTTQITLQPNGFRFRAGQYAFVNIPSITPLEWHPFTISSAPGDTALTFHIKNMGKQTWTARLANIYGYDGQSTARITTTPIVNIDGPYGNPPDFAHHENVVLVAGGIGITPMISIIKDLHQLYQQNDSRFGRIKNVYLMWVVRDLAILDMFKDVLDEIHNDQSCKEVFHIILQVTRRTLSAKVDGPAEVNPRPKMGRPNFNLEFAEIEKKCGRDDVIVMVCGPDAMVKEVKEAAYKCDFDLHCETFEL